MTVAVERVGNRINLTAPWAPDLPRKCKTIAGYNFATSRKCWTFPLSIEVCRQLREAFGQELEIGPSLWAWSATEIAREREIKPLIGAVDAELDHVPARAPELFKAMKFGRPYQLPAVKIAATRGADILADSPGLGKTIELLGAVVERFPLGGRHLIMAPSTSVRLVWEREIKRWLPKSDIGVFAMTGGRKRREGIFQDFKKACGSVNRPRHLFVVGNVEMARTKVQVRGKGHSYAHDYPELFKEEWDSVVFDESHKALITRISSTTNPKMTLTRRGAAMLKVAPGGARWAMTGTPFKGKTHNLWGTLNWLRPDVYTSFWTWARGYLEVKENMFGGLDLGGLRKDREAAFYREMDAIMIRRTKSELRKINPAWAPPEKQYRLVECEMSSKQAKQYKAMEDEAAVRLGDETLTANGILAEMTRLRQFAGACGTLEQHMKLDMSEQTTIFYPALPSGKFDRVLQELAERGISGDTDEQGGDGKVVVGSQFTKLINLFARELRHRGIECLVLTGETSAGDRERAVDAFQAKDGPRVMLINTTAGGVSITLDRADDMFILDETWVPDEQEQLEDRIHRTGNVDHQVVISYFITAGTIEEAISQANATADATQKLHLDGRRGVEFAKQWFGLPEKIL